MTYSQFVHQNIGTCVRSNILCSTGIYTTARDSHRFQVFDADATRIRLEARRSSRVSRRSVHPSSPNTIELMERFKSSSHGA